MRCCPAYASTQRFETWLSSYRSRSFPSIQLNKQRAMTVKYHKGEQQDLPSRAIAATKMHYIFTHKKLLFSFKFLYSPIRGKLNPETRCTCMAALPATETASQGNSFSHTDEVQLIPAGKQGKKNRTVHNFPGHFQFLWFKLQFPLLLRI